MKKLTSIFFSLVALQLFAQPLGYEDVPRIKENINQEWYWMKKDIQTPDGLGSNDAAWKNVSLPHNPDPVSLWLNDVKENWVQESFIRDISWYRKELPITVTEDQLVFLEFEGVHAVTEVWVNGQYAGKNDLGGYTPFHFDITKLVTSGEINEIVVKADNSMNALVPPDPHKTDYIKWGGIYRDVYLVTTNKLRVDFNWADQEAGVRITTPTVKRRYGMASVTTTVTNAHSSKKVCELITKIVNADGLVLKTMKDSSPVLSGSSYTFRQTTALEDEDYFTWSPERPYLYRAVSYVYEAGKLVDFVENRFGFRKLELVDGEGLLLNGKPFFMIGANRHQSFPHIGDAVPNSMHYEEALMYKEAGFNTLRLSHYPQDNAFIDACDELGILLYEEPATWIDWEQGIWMDKLEASARVMIRNHRNHPSIAIWGAGINHRGAVQRLALAAKEEDPTRFTGSASSPWNGMRHAGLTDIFATMDYRVSEWAEEGFTLVMEHGNNASSAMNQFHLSRYKKRKNNIGALAWVGADYYHLKPKADNPEKFTTYGMLDMYRTKRPVYHWYQSELNPEDMVYIADERVSTKGIVHVYSNADRVELYADGQLIRSQLPDNIQEKSNNDHPSFSFHFPWNGEALKALAYKGRKLVATHERKMPGQPYAIQLSVDYPEYPLRAGGSDIKTVRAYLVDKEGTIVHGAENKVTFEATGSGALVQGDADYMNELTPIEGAVAAYVKGITEPGKITVKATSGKLKSTSVNLTSIANETNEILNAASDIYDFPFYQIDIGHEGQLSQFDWKTWDISHETDLEHEETSRVKFKVSSGGTIAWSKGQPSMRGDLPFVGSDGVFVKDTTLYLTITGLEKGTYQLVSFHNAHSHKDQFPYNINSQAGYADNWQVEDQHLVVFTKNNDSGERGPISYRQFFEVYGQEPLRVYFRTDKNDSYTWLNGFELRRIK
ncbi:MAG: glycoside hydrolase family 2 TIM barrel-domain containing protein [Bacteroidota bacterium]